MVTRQRRGSSGAGNHVSPYHSDSFGLDGSSNSPISGIGIVVAVTLVSLLLVGILGGRQGLLAESRRQPASRRHRHLHHLGDHFITSVIIATAAISNDNLQT